MMMMVGFYRSSRSGPTPRENENSDHDDLDDDNDDGGGGDDEGEALTVSLFIIGAADYDFDKWLKTIQMWMIMMLPAQMMRMMPRTSSLSRLDLGFR